MTVEIIKRLPLRLRLHTEKTAEKEREKETAKKTLQYPLFSWSTTKSGFFSGRANLIIQTRCALNTPPYYINWTPLPAEQDRHSGLKLRWARTETDAYALFWDDPAEYRRVKGGGEGRIRDCLESMIYEMECTVHRVRLFHIQCAHPGICRNRSSGVEALVQVIKNNHR